MTRYHDPGHQYICLKLSRKINKLNFENVYSNKTLTETWRFRRIRFFGTKTTGLGAIFTLRMQEM
jgi:hypothetical protein